MPQSPKRQPVSVSLAAAACFALGLPTAAAAADNRLSLGRSQWISGHYSQARDTLYGYRYAPYGRTAHVDYMLGTASCRIPFYRSWGADLLQHILKRYPLSPNDRRVVSYELNLCRGASALPAVSGASLQVGVTGIAGAWGRGKGGYHLNTKTPNSVFQAVSIEPVDEAILQQRLIPVGAEARMREALGAVAPPGAAIFVQGRYAFVTTASHSKKQINSIAKRLDLYLDFLEREYQLQLPDNYLTLYLVRSNNELKWQAKRLHNIEVSRNTIGYAYHGDQSTIAIIPGTRIGTLFHEIFHLVVRTSFGDIPQWLDEGLASLYEVSAFTGKKLAGVPNWRGPVLHKLWDKRPLIETLIRAEWFTGDAVAAAEGGDTKEATTVTPETMAVHFAAQRYLMLYLQERGRLGAVFQAVRALPPDAPPDPGSAAVNAVVRHAGPISFLQRDFDAWFLRTKGYSSSHAKQVPVDPDEKRSRRKKRCDSPQEQSNC